jgi:transcriptional regulator with XRE-family HTH domain
MALAEPADDTPAKPPWTLGDRIARARRHAGWEQDDLATRVGVSRALISKWERDKAEPRPSQLERVASETEVSLIWLLGLDERSRCFPLLTLVEGGNAAADSLAGSVDRHPAGQGTSPS